MLNSQLLKQNRVKNCIKSNMELKNKFDNVFVEKGGVYMEYIYSNEWC